MNRREFGQVVGLTAIGPCVKLVAGSTEPQSPPDCQTVLGRHAREDTRDKIYVAAIGYEEVQQRHRTLLGHLAMSGWGYTDLVVINDVLRPVNQRHDTVVWELVRVETRKPGAHTVAEWLLEMANHCLWRSLL